MDAGMRVQAAMILDELPPHITKAIEEKQEDLAAIAIELMDKEVNLSGYYSGVTELKEQIRHTAHGLYEFFKARKSTSG